MISVLEYACNNLIGPPHMPGNYDCPVCQCKTSYRICTKEAGHHRFRCKPCGNGGDLLDLLKQFNPDEDFGQRKLREAAIELEFQEWQAKNPHARSSQEVWAGGGSDDPAKLEAAFEDVCHYFDVLCPELFGQRPDRDEVTRLFAFGDALIGIYLKHDLSLDAMRQRLVMAVILKPLLDTKS